jgi:hypothetical protein
MRNFIEDPARLALDLRRTSPAKGAAGFILEWTKPAFSFLFEALPP